MDEKVRFIAAVLAEEHSMMELCESFGVSRKTGYKWRLRYSNGTGRRGLRVFAGRRIGCHGRSRRNRRPRSSACAMRIRAGGLRSCGPSSCSARRSRPGRPRVPSASCCGGQGLSQQRKRRRHAVPNPGPLTVAASANDVWCIDFKGWFRTADHAVDLL